MFSSIQDQLAIYRLPKQHMLKNITSVQQLPLQSYEYLPIAPTKQPVHVPESMQPTLSPRKLGLALPVKFENGPTTLASSFQPGSINSQNLIPNQQSLPLTATKPLARSSFPNQTPQTLPKSRASGRKHHIFDDKIYKSAIRTNSRKHLAAHFGDPVSNTQRFGFGLGENIKLQSRLFNQSIGSTRFYNQNQQKRDDQSPKLKFPVGGDRNRIQVRSSSSRLSKSRRIEDSGSQSNIMVHLEKPSSKEVESRLIPVKQNPISPSNRTQKSHNKKIPKTRKKQLESKDYNQLAINIEKPNRFFDSQKTNFGERPTTKPNIFFNADFARIPQSKSATPALPESLEEMLRKLDKRSKIIALLVIMMVVSLVVYEIIR